MTTTFLPVRPKTAVAALLLPVVLLGSLPQWSCGCGKDWMAERGAPVVCSMAAGECQHTEIPALLEATKQHSCCHKADKPCDPSQQAEQHSGIGADKCRQIVQFSAAATARIEVAQIDRGHDAALAGLLPNPTLQLRVTEVLRATPAEPGGTQDLLILLQRLLL